MMERQEDVFHYITVMNENYEQPSLPAGVEDQVMRGMYRFATHAPEKARGRVRLLGAGTILREVIAAAALLAEHWGVASEVYSVTSFSELAREAREVERWNRLHPEAVPRSCHVADCLPGRDPVVAASDYVRAVPQMIADAIDARMTVLGTDGFGRSDTRQALRRFFEVDRHHVVLAALQGLARSGQVDSTLQGDAIKRYGLDPELPPPWTV